MRRSLTPPLLALGVVLVSTACGGTSSDAAPMEDAMAAAPVTLEAGGCYLQGATLEEAENTRPSPLQQTEIVFEGGAARLCYGSPAAAGRIVMGALVPFGDLWRSGANEPTTIHLTSPASIGGVALEPGSYSLYAVPGESEWEFFLNTNFERWGIPISDEVRGTEVGSFTTTPTLIDESVERLSFRYEVNNENTMGDLVMEWENTQLRFHVHPGG